MNFPVIAVDRFNNPKVRGGDQFMLQIGGAAPVTFKKMIKGQKIKGLEDNQDGTYTITYIAIEPGIYSLGVRVAPTRSPSRSSLTTSRTSIQRLCCTATPTARASRTTARRAWR